MGQAEKPVVWEASNRKISVCLHGALQRGFVFQEPCWLRLNIHFFTQRIVFKSGRRRGRPIQKRETNTCSCYQCTLVSWWGCSAMTWFASFLHFPIGTSVLLPATGKCASRWSAGEGYRLTFQSRFIEGHLLLEMTCCYTKASNRAPRVRISLIIRTLTTGDGATATGGSCWDRSSFCQVKVSRKQRQSVLQYRECI